MTTLEPYRWKNRLLLVFAPTPESETYLEQRRLLEDEEEALRDRDLLISHLFETRAGMLGDDEVSLETTTTLRERFVVGGGAFVVVLVGKDGDEKERYLEPVYPENLYRTIDAMPMRQREMRGAE